MLGWLEKFEYRRAGVAQSVKQQSPVVISWLWALRQACAQCRVGFRFSLLLLLFNCLSFMKSILEMALCTSVRRYVISCLLFCDVSSHWGSSPKSIIPWRVVKCTSSPLTNSLISLRNNKFLEKRLDRLFMIALIYQFSKYCIIYLYSSKVSHEVWILFLFLVSL